MKIRASRKRERDMAIPIIKTRLWVDLLYGESDIEYAPIQYQKDSSRNIGQISDRAESGFYF